MTERKERCTVARVALSGTLIQRTLGGVEAHLLDLNMCGARVAHFGILRPGSRCFIRFPGDVCGLYVPVRVAWCVILGAEWPSDGERHLWAHSRLEFMMLTSLQRAVLADYPKQASTREPVLQERPPSAAESALDGPRLSRRPGLETTLPGHEWPQWGGDTHEDGRDHARGHRGVASREHRGICARRKDGQQCAIT